MDVSAEHVFDPAAGRDVVDDLLDLADTAWSRPRSSADRNVSRILHAAATEIRRLRAATADRRGGRLVPLSNRALYSPPRAKPAAAPAAD